MSRLSELLARRTDKLRGVLEYVIAEMRWGTDAEEADYFRAVAEGDAAAIDRHEAEMADRMRRAELVLAQDTRTVRLTHTYRPLPRDRRPQDNTFDGAGWTYELLDHGTDASDTMPQAIRATDPFGRSAIYLAARADGRVIDHVSYKLERVDE